MFNHSFQLRTKLAYQQTNASRFRRNDDNADNRKYQQRHWNDKSTSQAITGHSICSYSTRASFYNTDNAYKKKEFAMCKLQTADLRQKLTYFAIFDW